MKVLVYLHGLGSKGKSDKSDALRAALEPMGIKVLTPNLPINPSEVDRLVKDLVIDEMENLEKLVFCGTSLGGFYSSYFGEIFDAPYVITNPATNPSTTFEQYLDNPPVSWATGKPLDINRETLNTFAAMESAVIPTGILANVFLAKDDEVVPYEVAAEKYKYAATLDITKNGGHRYEENWGEVIKCVTSLF